MKKTTVRAISLLVVLFTCVFLACGTKEKNADKDTQSLIPGMRKAYGNVFELYSYAWDEESFFSKKSEPEITRLLKSLGENFHEIDDQSGMRALEPGFKITLAQQQDLISELQAQFKRGNKDYVQWRLRGLAQNCISCHTQIQDSTKFFTSMPKDKRDSRSFEKRSSEAEFLLATRQFKSAAKSFLSLAKDLIDERAEEIKISYALKHWLLTQVRVIRNKERVLKELAKLIKSTDYDVGLNEVLINWKNDLGYLELNNQLNPAQCTSKADSYLKPYAKIVTFKVQDERLVKTLYFTSCLHQTLQEQIDTSTRKKALFLLAVAYDRMPISFFELNRELYSEQVILEYPQTVEAEIAFELFQERVFVSNTGSGGLHLDLDQQQRLKKLRSLAYGEDQSTLDDSRSADSW